MTSVLRETESEAMTKNFDGRHDEFGRPVVYRDAPTSAYPERETDPKLGDELRDLFNVFRRDYRIILAMMIGAMFLALAYIWITPPLYSATVELLIDPRQKQMFDDEVSPSGLGSSAAGADTLLLESQLEVIASQSVIERLMMEEQITEDREYVGTSSSTFVQTLKTVAKTILFGPHDATWKQTSPHDRALKKLRRNMDIKRQRNTYVIGITMLSKNAEKAARLANRMAEIYIGNVNSAGADTTREAATSLDSKLEELRLSAQLAAEKVETYKTAKDLIGTREVLVVEQQLRDLNDQLSQANVEAQTSLSILNQVRAASALGDLMATGEIAQSQVMSQLQTRLAEIEAQRAQLSATHLPQHPQVLQLRERKLALQTSLRTEYQRILNRLQADYDSASEKANSIAAGVADLKNKVAVSNTDSVQLRELERAAETNRTVYETFLTRSKEAWEQVDIPNSTARVISAAYPASRPAYPAVPLLLAGALLVGMFSGFVVAWLRHILRPAPIPAPVFHNANAPSPIVNLRVHAKRAAR